jgi:hypothetical protein
MTFSYPLTLLVMLALPTMALAAEQVDRTIDFREGQWDRSAWTPLRLIHQPEPGVFEQRAESIGNGAFTDEQKKAALDNVLLMTDAGAGAQQIELTFTIGPERGAAPAIFLTPKVENGVLQSALAVFVADYTMAVWWAQADAETGKMTYTHLVRMNRWSQPGERHVLRCRFAPRGDTAYDVLLQLDDSDVIAVYRRDTAEPFDWRVGIWGCHGTCDFHELRILREGTLPWSGERPQ